jgi:hypothetical protein
VYAAQRNHNLDIVQRAKNSKVATNASSTAVNPSASSSSNKPAASEAKPPVKASQPAAVAEPAPASSHVTNLGVGASLPSDASCASRIKPAAETRPANSTYNSTRGIGSDTTYPRVSGNYSGTTDEILQWAACKWGIDEDIARAQAAVESWWFQRHPGDFTTDSTICVPGHRVLGADGQPGQCPETIGILQVRYQ